MKKSDIKGFATAVPINQSAIVFKKFKYADNHFKSVLEMFPMKVNEDLTVRLQATAARSPTGNVYYELIHNIYNTDLIGSHVTVKHGEEVCLVIEFNRSNEISNFSLMTSLEFSLKYRPL